MADQPTNPDPCTLIPDPSPAASPSHTEVPHVDVPQAHRDAADRAKRLFVPVPMSKIERDMPDPDFESPPAASPGVDMREQLAALAHEQWAGWMRYLFEKGAAAMTGGVYLPSQWSDRWERQMNTPYAELSEVEKESDRTEADRVLALFAAERQQHTALLAELVEAMTWIRVKIGVPADAQMFSGESSIAGRLHVICGHADGYMRYIEAFKCDDKQGEIARLNVRAAKAEAEVASLTQQLTEARQENERLKHVHGQPWQGQDAPMELARRVLEAEQARAALQQQLEEQVAYTQTVMEVKGEVAEDMQRVLAEQARTIETLKKELDRANMLHDATCYTRPQLAEARAEIARLTEERDRFRDEHIPKLRPTRADLQAALARFASGRPQDDEDAQ